MMEERLVLDGDVVYELRLRSPRDWRLACLRGGRLLVELRSGRAYEFTSVEKLRYDFEREAEDALAQD
jgi:hypothetical protein